MPNKQKWERIKEQLHDYAVLLKDRGDKSGEMKLGQRMPRKKPGVTGISSYSNLNATRAEEDWYREKLVEWRQEKRLTGPPDFLLRVPKDHPEPYTLARVKSAMPWLETWDALAVLVELDGVVEANYMDAHKNIREVVEKIADERVAHALQGRDETTTIRDLIRTEIGAVFGELLGNLGQKVTPQLAGTAGRGQRKCSKCGGLGHMRTTCTASGAATPDKWNCAHCTSLSGKGPNDMITHAVPPTQFHQQDPSFNELEEAAAV